MNDTPDLEGYVFLNHFRYWKVCGKAYSFMGHMSYPVVNCSKNGKEYKTRSGFSVAYVLKLHKFGETRKIGDVGKANTSGAKVAAMKRRAMFLQDRIEKDTLELNTLLKELS